jgi:hypothetical protein
MVLPWLPQAIGFFGVRKMRWNGARAFFPGAGALHAEYDLINP